MTDPGASTADILARYEYERKVAQYCAGWEATLTEKGDIRTFTKLGYTIHLHGKLTVTLTGEGLTEELSFHQAAVKILAIEERKQNG